jgi:hypothetical protein
VAVQTRMDHLNNHLGASRHPSWPGGAMELISIHSQLQLSTDGNFGDTRKVLRNKRVAASQVALGPVRWHNRLE